MTIHIIERVYTKDGMLTKFETADIAFHTKEEAIGNLWALGYNETADNTYTKDYAGETLIARVKSMNVY